MDQFIGFVHNFFPSLAVVGLPIGLAMITVVFCGLGALQLFHVGLLLVSQVGPLGAGEITNAIAQFSFGGAAFYMLWRMIQQSNENERKRQEDAQAFVKGLMEGLDRNTKATADLSLQFRDFMMKAFQNANQQTPQARRRAQEDSAS